MKRVRAMKESSMHLALMCVGVVLLGLGSAHSSVSQTTVQPPKRAVCSAAEYRQFDFWLGDWDTFEPNAPDKSIARNHVDSILDGCALREDFEQIEFHDLRCHAQNLASELGNESRSTACARRREAK